LNGPPVQREQCVAIPLVITRLPSLRESLFGQPDLEIIDTSSKGIVHDGVVVGREELMEELERELRVVRFAVLAALTTKGSNIGRSQDLVVMVSFDSMKKHCCGNLEDGKKGREGSEE
jgi:hypothetical protein